LFFAVLKDAEAVVFDIATIERVFVAVDGHQSCKACFIEPALHGLIVTGKIRIAIKNKESGKQNRQRPSNRSSRAQKNRAVEGIFKRESESQTRTVSELLLNKFTEISDCEDDSTRAVAREQLELMPEKRMSRNIDQCLWDALNKRPQA